MHYILVAAGLCLLLLGGELLVRGAVALARRLGVSPLIIGLTIVAYGTSAPELLVSLDANLAGAPGIAIGNVIGSNLANLLLIVGAGAVISPISCSPGSIRLTGPALLGATGLLVVLGLSGAITPWAGAGMLGLLAAYTLYSYRTARQENQTPTAEAALHIKEVQELADGTAPLAVSLPSLAAGLAGVIAGSYFLVEGAVGLARSFEIPETTIGLTLVAFGTSLPELATAVVAAYRRHSDVALGNVVGSNLFNILGVLGVVPLFGALPVPGDLTGFDLWVMLGVTLFFVLWVMARNSVGRLLGAGFLIVYGLYIAAHFHGFAAVAVGRF